MGNIIRRSKIGLSYNQYEVHVSRIDGCADAIQNWTGVWSQQSSPRSRLCGTGNKWRRN